MISAIFKRDHPERHLQVIRPAKEAGDCKTIRELSAHYRNRNAAGGHNESRAADKFADFPVHKIFQDTETKDSKLNDICEHLFRKGKSDFIQMHQEVENNVVLLDWINENYEFSQEIILSACEKFKGRPLSATYCVQSYIEKSLGRGIDKMDTFAKSIQREYTLSRREFTDRRNANIFAKIVTHLYGLEMALRYDSHFNMPHTDLDFSLLLNDGSSPRKHDYIYRDNIDFPIVEYLTYLDGEVIIALRKSAKFEKFKSTYEAWLNPNSAIEKKTNSELFLAAFEQYVEFICSSVASQNLNSLERGAIEVCRKTSGLFSYLSCDRVDMMSEALKMLGIYYFQGLECSQVLHRVVDLAKAASPKVDAAILKNKVMRVTENTEVTIDTRSTNILLN